MGGLAVGAHGAPRNTTDADFLVGLEAFEQHGALLVHKAGVPVRWKVDGTQAFGCTSILTIPSLNVRQSLHAGENTIEFTPPSKPGPLAFMCSMGMVRGTFNVI